MYASNVLSSDSNHRAYTRRPQNLERRNMGAEHTPEIPITDQRNLADLVKGQSPTKLNARWVADTSPSWSFLRTLSDYSALSAR